ncbi:MAG: hypothetical protein M1814_002884 [Vezdaea aestivalis]|nr:MAG: hypothetical protein M1814_002884 [Vezdaea aestivalis]
MNRAKLCWRCKNATLSHKQSLPEPQRIELRHPVGRRFGTSHVFSRELADSQAPRPQSRPPFEWQYSSPETATEDKEAGGASKDFIVIRRPRPKGQAHSRNQGVSSSQEPPPDIEAASQQIFDQVIEDENSAPPGKDEYLGHLNAIKGSYSPGVIANEKWDTLWHNLNRGFTSRQLGAYIAKNIDLANPVGPDLRYPPSFPFLERTPWVSGKAPVKVRHPSAKIEPRAGRARKKGLIDAIMGECWGLERDQGRMLGEVDVRLDPTHLKLLMNTHDLEALGRRFDARISTASTDGYLRIRTTKASSELLLQEIARISLAMKHIDVDFDKFKAVFFRTQRSELVPDVLAQMEASHLLDLIAYSTGTVIERIWSLGQRRKKSSKKAVKNNSPMLPHIRIHFLGSQTGAAEEARRQILYVLGIDRAPIAGLFTSKSLDNIEIEDGQFSMRSIGRRPSLGSLPDLPFRIRAFPWARYTAESTSLRPDESTNSQSTLSAIKSLSGPSLARIARSIALQRLRLSDGEVKLSQPTSPWQLECVDTISVGQLLHLSDSRAKVVPSQDGKGREPVLEPVKRILSESVPGLLSAIEDLETLSPLKREMVIQCLPSPWENAGSPQATKLPTLELRIAIGSHGARLSQEPVSVTALVDERRCAIMLPHHLADLEVRRQRLFKIVEPEALPSIQGFLSSSRLSLKRGEQLDTPLTLDMELPANVLQTMTALHKSRSPADVQRVSYLVVGIEFTETFDFSYKGSGSFSLTQREGGLLGGRGTRVSISGHSRQPSKNRRAEGQKSEGGLDDILKASFDLVKQLKLD